MPVRLPSQPPAIPAYCPVPRTTFQVPKAMPHGALPESNRQGAREEVTPALTPAQQGAMLVLTAMSASRESLTTAPSVGDSGTEYVAASNMTVFRAFEPNDFLEWPAWTRLQTILKSNGGSYGLSGARGAGKSWLMLRAIEWVRSLSNAGRLGGIGLWYPSPSEYDPLAFLASLSDSLGNEIDRWFRRNPQVRKARAFQQLAIVSLGTLLAGSLAVYLTVMTPSPVVRILGWLALGIVAASAVVLLFRSPVVRFRSEGRLVAEAKLVRERARYTVTRREAAEFGAEGGRGVIARARTARERELVERPATLSSLVNDFRALAWEAGAVAGRVVIAIDELDKMAEPDKVRALLRDIKGIFDVPHVYFLVSVSEEAARSLSLGALTGRDEFNSSFYTVIEVKPGRPDELAELLERRSEARVTREVALVLAALAGGNPREVLRLAELVTTARTGANAVVTGAEAVVEVLKEEALILRREIVTAPSSEQLPELGAEARVAAFTALPDSSFETPEALSHLALNVLSDLWEPSWEDQGFRSRFGEAWRRLMVRIAVGRELIASRALVRDPALAQRLRDVVVAATQSAQVARLVLERELRVETERPTASQEDVRQRLEALARRYEEVRGSMPGGDRRTRLMDDVAREARSIARDAGSTRDEIASKLASKAAGDRVVALATIEATGEPDHFEDVLVAAVTPHAPFEGYHALLALQTLLPSLTAAQRDRVEKALSSVEFEQAVGNDPPREALAKRILGAVARETTRTPA